MDQVENTFPTMESKYLSYEIKISQVFTRPIAVTTTNLSELVQRSWMNLKKC